MQCSKCQFENPKGINYCGECGAKLERLCPSCHSLNPPNFKFCGECGSNLNPAQEISNAISETESLPFAKPQDEPSNDIGHNTGERKHVTVLFSDLNGYTAMSEKLDPEESRLFKTLGGYHRNH